MIFFKVTNFCINRQSKKPLYRINNLKHFSFGGTAAEHFFFIPLFFGAGVMYAHIYIYIQVFTLYFIFCYHIVTSNYVYVFILLYMVLYKHISYHKIPFCISLRNKCLVSFFKIIE